MSEQEFELYLKLLSRCLGLTPSQREQIADELRDHLEERLEELARAGVPREQAVVQALDEFGAAAVLAGDFAAITRLKRRRFLMRLSLGSVGVLTAALLVAYAFWPENKAVRGPERVVAQDKPRDMAHAKAGPPEGAAQKPFAAGATASKQPSGNRAAGFAKLAPPPAVNVCRPVTKEVTDYQSFKGYLQPSQVVRVIPLASGYLKKTDFRPGQVVKPGEVLFELDPAAYQADVDKAAAELTRSEAKLTYAVQQFQRVQYKVQHNAIAPDDLDKAASERRVAEADRQLATANVELAHVRLLQARIVAPIAGHIGGSVIDVGNFVKAEESTLATIRCLDPLYASINMDDSSWFLMRRRVRHGDFRGSEIPVEIYPPAGEPQRKGTLEFLEDAAFVNGNTVLRVRVPNSDGGLLPGLFVQIQYAASNPHSALLVPSGAVGAADGRAFVWVLGEQNIAVRRSVAINSFMHEGGLREITQGLGPDEWIACDPEQASRVVAGKPIEPKRVP